MLPNIHHIVRHIYIMKCQALIQKGTRKGEICGNDSNEEYCRKHIRQSIIDKAKQENIRYCDIARGCYTILDAYQNKCKHCLHKARIYDRKRHDKKRQDPNKCLDCGNILTDDTRAKGKHNRRLRRCEPCYKKLLQYESNRPKKERNYKAHYYNNKHAMWNSYIKGAKDRGINFSLSKEIFNKLIIEPCFYCAKFKEKEVNGIDRIDNNKGYEEGNVVSCCSICNIAKGRQHPQEFIDKLRSIHLYYTTHQPISPEFIEKWKTTYISVNSKKYKTYQKGAVSRNYEWSITEDEFNSIIKQACYLCGLQSDNNNYNGIDRYDNNKGYILDNCRSCCGHCNLLKMNMNITDILNSAEKVSNNYNALTDYLSTKQIQMRRSKISPRIKVEDPITQEHIITEYKPLNEIIIPKETTPSNIISILNPPIMDVIPKQWKTKQIYEFIQEGKENEYKQYCEEHNTPLSSWEVDWTTFVRTIKGKSEEEASPIIHDFVENLRRIRHNQLCKKDILERDNRQQWPASTVVQAFLEGKIESFKHYTEQHAGESPEDPKWVKRWNQFLQSLKDAHQETEKMKKICSQFMTAQRVKKYRRGKQVAE